MSVYNEPTPTYVEDEEGERDHPRTTFARELYELKQDGFDIL